MVLLRASLFMCATISTSPVLASVTTAVTRPSAPNCGAKDSPSSIDGSVKLASRLCNAGSLALRAPQHGHETHLFVRIVTERAGEMRGHRQRAGFLDAAQRHAHVLGLNHHRHTARLQNLIDRGGH